MLRFVRRHPIMSLLIAVPVVAQGYGFAATVADVPEQARRARLERGAADSVLKAGDRDNPFYGHGSTAGNILCFGAVMDHYPAHARYVADLLVLNPGETQLEVTSFVNGCRAGQEEALTRIAASR